MASIIMINASLRKQSTYKLLTRIASHFNQDEIEFLNLSDYEIRPCIGCENCLRNGTCSLPDQADEVLHKIQQADGIILGSPVYLRQISGYLKLLIDRGCAWYHRSPLVGKPIFFATTTMASGSKQAVRYLQDLSVQWGTIYTGSISRTLFNLDAPVHADQLKRFKFYLDDQNRSSFRPPMKQVIEFNTQKVLATAILPLDLEFWTEKGYIDSPYYFTCRISLFKRLVGRIYYKLLLYLISKNKA